jgi:threonine/homoserine/homoserine lactone efflux protein
VCKLIPFLTAGLILGFSAGVAPGPLVALVIAETLKHNLKAGIRVAFAPVITDLPIVILALVVLSRLSDLEIWLAAISIAGGLFVACLGWQNLRATGLHIGLSANIQERSLQKAVLVNFLSPHPYLFWLTVGAPMAVRAMGQSMTAAAAFIGGFYALLVGSKIAIAVIVAKSSRLLTGRAFTGTMRCLGIVLFVLAALLIYDGIQMTGLF